MDKREVEEALEEIGTLLELRGENPFKCRAYLNAARTLRGLEADLAGLVESGDLRKVKGIGEALAEKIATLVRTGSLPYLEELRASLPPGLLDLLRIPGLGPKRIKLIHDELGVASIGELEYACRENRLLTLKGFGPKAQANVLAGIERVKKYGERFLAPYVWDGVAPILQALEKHESVLHVSVAGSLRRRLETAKDADIVAAVKDGAGEEVGRLLAGHGEVKVHGATKTSVVLESGVALDLRCVSDAEYPYALMYFTGSKAHNVAMRGRAQKLGLKLNEYGLWKGDDRIPCRDEEEVFRALGLPFIPPELREDLGEIEAAEMGPPPRLLEESDIRGPLHCHTNWSDGSGTVARMAEAAREKGYSYIGIADHSQSARYAGGLDPARLREQGKEIAAWNAAHGKGTFRILHGIEADILPDGSLDLPDDVLASLDFVVASVHSGFRMTEEEMTRRVLRAIGNPHVSILGHPTGRLLLSRDPYPIDMHAILQEAGRLGVAVEINAHPSRLDLDWRLGRTAREHGVATSINPDAHSPEGLGDIGWGVGTARKGGFTREDVWNTLPVEELLDRTRRKTG